MPLQYKEYKVLDIDIGELLMLEIAKEDQFSIVTIEDIEEVHSHPVALAQCEQFLDNNLPKAIRYEHHDTAGSVVDIKKINKK